MDELIEQENQVNQDNDTKNVDKNNQPITYIEVVTEKDESGQPISVLEVDLVISREKGQETRRLSLNFAEVDVKNQEMVEKSVNIDRECFEVLKKYFCQLDWNS